MHPACSSFLSRHLLDRREGHRRKVLARASARRAWDGLSPDQRQTAQALALADLLNHARIHVPRFQRLLAKQGPIQPGMAFQILAGLPLMTRADIQANPEDFISDEPGPRWDDATGGSTGTPLRFKVDRDTQVAREASLLWADGFAGWRPGDRVAMLWGADGDVRSALRNWRQRLRNRIENRRWYNAFALEESRLAGLHADLEHFQPHLLVAYAGTALLLARYLAASHLRPDYPRRAVICSAERLDPAMRREIESIFTVPVLDRYGNREFGALAMECPCHAGLHVNDRDVVLELMGPAPEHDPAPVVLTYLCNRVMPFIRYDTGDLARAGAAATCACGRNGLRLNRVVGRQSDTMRTPDGRLIHGEFFTHLLYSATAVRQFQFIQEAGNRYTLRLVLAQPVAPEWEPHLKRRLAETLGASAQVNVEYCDRIAPSASGKHHFTVSRLARPPGAAATP